MKSADAIRVLLVEDSESDAFLIRTALSRLPERCELVHVETLAELREALAHGSYDVVLADLNLPDSTHATTMDFLLNDEIGVPMIALSSNDDGALTQRCAAHGIGCFSKQELFSPAFGQTLREQIARSSHAAVD